MSVEKINVNYTPTHLEFKVPVRSTEQAGAWDVFVTEVVKESDDCYLAKLGFKAEFSSDYKLIIAPRSSITKTKWNMQNTPGIGDPDFRGEYSVRFRAFPEGVRFNSRTENWELYYPEFTYKVGDRCAQIYFQKRVDAHFFETEFLNETQRGEGAYGSTGK
jgi:dUTP pyrophosphatase